MRTTISIDDGLLVRAQQITGITERNALIRRALTEMVQREAGRRIIALGGSDPSAWAPNEGDESPA